MKATLVTSAGRVKRLRRAWEAAGIGWPRVQVVRAPDTKKGSAMIIGSLRAVLSIGKWTGGTVGSI
jgi:hypothetical protein